MEIVNYIENYIEHKNIGEPIFTNECYNYVKMYIPNLDKALFNLNLQRFEKRNKNFIRYQKGIYYKAIETPFGLSNIDETKLIQEKYMINGKEIIGYESGPSYLNKIGLTTQMPDLTYIVTEKTRYSMVEKKNKIYLVKPVTNINKENYRYLQFLDILDNKMKINIENEDYIKILRQYIKRFDLSFEKIIAYTKYYKNINIYKYLSEIASEVQI